MNWDKLFVSLWKDEYEPRINDENLIMERFSYVEKSKELYVFFPPWHSKLKYDWKLRNKITSSGASCLEYKFNGHFLSSDYKLTIKYFKEIRKNILSKISNLIKKYNFKKINIIGISLGCVNACMIANSLKKINELILIVPGNDLAESLWNGIKTKRLRKAFVKKGINLESLKKYWKELAPENNLDNLEFKKVKIYLSKSDKVIPYGNGKKLFDKISKRKNVEIHENKFLGHYLTAIEFYLFPKRFL